METLVHLFFYFAYIEDVLGKLFYCIFKIIDLKKSAMLKFQLEISDMLILSRDWCCSWRVYTDFS